MSTSLSVSVSVCLRNISSPAGAVAKYCNEYVCVTARYPQNHTVIFTNFLCMLRMAVARSSFGVIAIMLCTSGFVDDIVFSIIGRIAAVISPRRTDFAKFTYLP